MIQTYIEGTGAVNIAAGIERAVAEGACAPGALLPPVRQLASRLGVSPATVAAAYRSLQLRGVVVSDGRRGTRVRPQPPLVTAPPASIPGRRDLSGGSPDRRLLPSLDKALGAVDPEPRLYDEALNDERLLKLARRQFEADGVPAANLAVVSGALDGVERVLREHLQPGDRVAVEDPCFTGVLDLLGSLALVPVPVAIDDEGLLPEALSRVLKSVGAVVVTPRAQNPTGAAHSPRRAAALRRALKPHPGVLLVEDDHAGPVAGAPYATLVDRSRARWAVVRSVSKSLGPDLRLALVASDDSTHSRLEGRQLLGIRWVSHVLQRIVAALWSDAGTRRLLREAESAYAARRDALRSELSARGIASHGVSGLNVWIPVADESSVVQALADRGWSVMAGTRYRLASPPAIRVTISDLDGRETASFAADLADAVGTPRRAGV